ncbi:MAG: glycoside hydrolase family 57 protein [Prolixibacteraceae bacterium]|jgi:alpha-amylase|nr:glycoside hydrolase family 57 protein [Prolixibacteraceae bacterium]
MKTICLYFQLHQPFRYRRYRFFDIGNDSYYYDDYANETILQKVAQNCYLPANKLLLDAIEKQKGKFKIAFSLSGIALEQFQLYAPEVIESFKKLSDTGCVEFLSETFSHSLVALKSQSQLAEQVKKHDDLIESLFGQRPSVFRNTELIYSDEIGNMVNDMGFKAILTEGAKHVLGWKSPNFLYTNAINPRLKVLMRNYKLSDDLAFRFSNPDWSEYPLTAEKFANWIKQMDEKEEVVNLFMDYETFGEHQKKETGILDFLAALPAEVIKQNIEFNTPSEVVKKLQPVSAVHVPNPISWADEERDLSAWLGNELQEEAFNKLYSLLHRVEKCDDAEIIKDWEYLQVSDHFYYMCTKFFSDGEVHKYFNPYDSPYEAYINYMNVLSDFALRLDEFVPENEVKQQLSELQKTISEKNAKIKNLETENKKLLSKVKNTMSKPSTKKPKVVKKAAPKKK